MVRAAYNFARHDPAEALDFHDASSRRGFSIRSAAIFMTLAFATTALCTNLEPAFATKMDGRCCQWSDGGRSFRYRFATMRTEFPDVVRAHTVSCVNRSWNSMDG